MAKGKQKPIDIEKLAEKYKDLPPVSVEEFSEVIKQRVNTPKKKAKKQ